MKYFRLVMLVFAAMVAAVQAQPAARSAPSGNVTFVTGGVGVESAERMAALGKEYNLKLMFAAKDGHFLASVTVTVVDAAGRKVLETVSDGPFLFAQLAPGKYQVAASYDGNAQTRSTSVVAGAGAN
jgi:uncharacterized protein GlcG (DUF336 family)